MNSPSLHSSGCWTRPTNPGRTRGAGSTTAPRLVDLLHGQGRHLVRHRPLFRMDIAPVVHLMSNHDAHTKSANVYAAAGSQIATNREARAPWMGTSNA